MGGVIGITALDVLVIGSLVACTVIGAGWVLVKLWKAVA